MENKIDQLEYTVMELGTEIFRLKSQISEMTVKQKKIISTFDSLKEIMEDKGIITADDFEFISTNQHCNFEDMDDALEAIPEDVDTKTEFH